MALNATVLLFVFAAICCLVVVGFIIMLVLAGVAYFVYTENLQPATAVKEASSPSSPRQRTQVCLPKDAGPQQGLQSWAGGSGMSSDRNAYPLTHTSRSRVEIIELADGDESHGNSSQSVIEAQRSSTRKVPLDVVMCDSKERANFEYPSRPVDAVLSRKVSSDHALRWSGEGTSVEYHHRKPNLPTELCVDELLKSVKNLDELQRAYASQLASRLGGTVAFHVANVGAIVNAYGLEAADICFCFLCLEKLKDTKRGAFPARVWTAALARFVYSAQGMGNATSEEHLKLPCLEWKYQLSDFMNEVVKCESALSCKYGPLLLQAFRQEGLRDAELSRALVELGIKGLGATLKRPMRVSSGAGSKQMAIGDYPVAPDGLRRKRTRTG